MLLKKLTNYVSIKVLNKQVFLFIVMKCLLYEISNKFDQKLIYTETQSLYKLCNSFNLQIFID